MSFKTEAGAQAKADEIRVKQQLGPEWKTVIWENMGWHLLFELGPVVVHYDSSNLTDENLFSALLADSDGTAHSGSGLWTTHSTHRTVVEAAVNEIRKFLRYKNTVLKHEATIATAMLKHYVEAMYTLDQTDDG